MGAFQSDVFPRLLSVLSLMRMQLHLAKALRFGSYRSDVLLKSIVLHCAGEPRTHECKAERNTALSWEFNLGVDSSDELMWNSRLGKYLF
jgi:hypothetical protein